MHGWRLESDLGPIVLAEFGDELAVLGLEALEKIDVKEGAAKLAVGDPLKAHILLGAHDFADARVLDGVQLGGGEAASGENLGASPQPFGTKKASDVIGAKRRTGHVSSLKSTQPSSLLNGLTRSRCWQPRLYTPFSLGETVAPKGVERRPSFDGLRRRMRDDHLTASRRKTLSASRRPRSRVSPRRPPVRDGKWVGERSAGRCRRRRLSGPRRRNRVGVGGRKKSRPRTSRRARASHRDRSRPAVLIQSLRRLRG